MGTNITLSLQNVQICNEKKKEKIKKKKLEKEKEHQNHNFFVILI